MTLRAFAWIPLPLAFAAAAGGARPWASSEAQAKRRVEVIASRYAFEPALIEVGRGDVVEVVLRSADTDHGLAVKAYGLKVKVPKGGASVTASFVADKPGRFAVECSEYCGSGHKRMRGELVVAEASR